MAFLQSLVTILFCFVFISILKQTENALAEEYTCNARCSSYACMTNATLCQRNRFLSQCGCCHLCVKGNNELCGGEFGKYGICGRGLRCTVRIRRFLLSENGPTGLCKPIACLQKCKRPAPVCGSNGFIFKNLCEMGKFACLGGTKITSRPLSECISNRRCERVRGACDFVLQSSVHSSFHSVRRQSFGNCHGLSSCSSRRYAAKSKCANNLLTYTSRCQKNIHACILGERLKWGSSGKCQKGIVERIPLVGPFEAFGILYINGTENTPRQVFTFSGDDSGSSGQEPQIYNSSDPNSLT